MEEAPWYMGFIHWLVSATVGGAAPGGPVYLDAIQAPPAIASGAAVEVTIGGSLPSPAYALVEPVIDRGDHRVTIHLASKLKGQGGMSIQMLQPFTRKITLAGLADGDWIITADAPKSDPKEVAVKVGS